jgi:hypothetical protein
MIDVAVIQLNLQTVLEYRAKGDESTFDLMPQEDVQQAVSQQLKGRSAVRLPAARPRRTIGINAKLALFAANRRLP